MTTIINGAEFELIEVYTEDCDGCYFENKLCNYKECVKLDDEGNEHNFIFIPKEL